VDAAQGVADRAAATGMMEPTMPQAFFMHFDDDDDNDNDLLTLYAFLPLHDSEVQVRI
jgi:hypothetical protein